MAASFTPAGSPYISGNFDLLPPSPTAVNTLLPNAPSNGFELYPSASYSGSYNNSPFSGHSELSFNGDNEPFGLFDDDQHANIPIADYDPSEYDPPNSNSLLIFNDNDFMNHSNDPDVSSISFAPFDHRSPFDHSSPSSNGGSVHGAESGPEGDISRSRGSSISSVNHNSPRLQVAQSLEGMTFHSPRWGSGGLPLDPTMSPPQKPQSPPQLMIPDSSASNGSTFNAQPPPAINAPAGDGGFMNSGPQLHIVPATPVSGGGAASQSVPFHTTLETLHQGSSLGQQPPSSWDHSSEQMPTTDESHFPSPAQHPIAPQHSHHNDALSSTLQIDNSRGLGFFHPNQSNEHLPNSMSRMRSHSDHALEAPLWQSSGLHPSQTTDGSALETTVNMNDILPGASSQQQHFRSQSQQSSYNPSHHTSYSFDAPSSSNNGIPNNFLSPDMSGLRRARSDTSSPRQGHTRQSRSEDFSPAAMLYPPSPHLDMLSRQYLHPQEPVSNIRGHHRRASSGSRDRGPAAWSNNSSARASPYPSPNVSPRGIYDELPNVALSGRQGLRGPLDPPGFDGYDAVMVGDGRGGMVSKPNVTTGRTANASHKRRKQPANFICPVPGCGSTFTRSFNLKGHIRSHNEEKPYQCPWPGCGKGFARQHDCKRHEQLHTNYRPFTCDGCQKQFARMDALNRHLKSDNGLECQQKLDVTNTTAPQGADTNKSLNPTPNGWDDQKPNRGASNTVPQLTMSHMLKTEEIGNGGWSNGISV